MLYEKLTDLGQLNQFWRGTLCFVNTGRNHYFSDLIYGLNPQEIR